MWNSAGHTHYSEETDGERSEGRVNILVPDGDRGLRWITALAAAQIPYELMHDAEQWFISVPEDWAEAAEVEISEYERVNRNFPPPEVFPCYQSTFPTFPVWGAGFVFALVVLIMDLIRGFFASRVDFLEEGVLNIEAVWGGDYARIVTALTLHGDLPHLLGNVLGGLLLVSVAGGWLGTGVALLLVIVSGALGNLSTVCVATAPYQALGASTAVFGTLGILTTMQVAWNIRRFGRKNIRQIWRRSWIAFAAAVALLGLAGTGGQADVGGHLFGFLAGLIIGLPPGCLQGTRAATGWQWATGLCALLLVGGAWCVALWW